MSTIKVLSINLKKALVDEMEMNLTGEDIIFYSAFGFTESLKMARLCLPHIFIISENRKRATWLKIHQDTWDTAVFGNLFAYLTEQSDGDYGSIESGADEILPYTLHQVYDRSYIIPWERFKRTENPIQIKDGLL
jgi:hypothetical protein